MSEIHVCPLSALGETLESSGARHMIGLAAPGKSEPRPAQITGAFLALEFNDINEPRDGLITPTQNDIYSLTGFFDHLPGDEPVVVQCWMGISRSPAAALIGCVRLLGEKDLAGIVRALRTTSPMATPNPLMIKLADDALGLQGRFVEAVNAIGRGIETSQGLPFVLDTRHLET